MSAQKAEPQSAVRLFARVFEKQNRRLTEKNPEGFPDEYIIACRNSVMQHFCFKGCG